VEKTRAIASDRIEAILLTTATQQQTNTFVLGEVATKLDQLTSRVDQVAAEVANLNDILMASIEIAETDRQTFQAGIPVAYFPSHTEYTYDDIAPKSRNTLHLTSPELVREDWLSSGIANTDAIAWGGSSTIAPHHLSNCIPKIHNQFRFSEYKNGGLARR